ncbi:hypothetical protein GWI33_019979 [Rhynchophorus ferrugineus]|uniref:Uncharacterized protein n=1 Tax=Rhynchophorus ferrugineus TaxID=354439 RepID=A0A834HQB6_RHYFE|nr:hypothetical protein GWI33_019979 [Rhynchophorus ferrugineus]
MATFDVMSPVILEGTITASINSEILFTKLIYRGFVFHVTPPPPPITCRPRRRLARTRFRQRLPEAPRRETSHIIFE